MYVGDDENPKADISVPVLESAIEKLCSLAPAIVIQLRVALYFAGLEPGIRCIGFCHADDVTQYYRPLSWYEPAIVKFIAVSKECARNLASIFPVEHKTSPRYRMNLRADDLHRKYQTKPLRMIYAGRVTQPQKRVWISCRWWNSCLRDRVPSFSTLSEKRRVRALQHVFRTHVPAADVRFHPRVPHREMAARWVNHDFSCKSRLRRNQHQHVGSHGARCGSRCHCRKQRYRRGNYVWGKRLRGTSWRYGRHVPGHRKTRCRPESSAANRRCGIPQRQPYSIDLYATKFVQILDDVAERNDKVEYQSRYGIYTPKHPLLLQRQKLIKQKQEIERSIDDRLVASGKREWIGLDRFGRIPTQAMNEMPRKSRDP